MKQVAHILIVDDEVELLGSLLQLLEFDFTQISTLNDPALLPAFLSDHQVDVILLDMHFGQGANTENDGLFWLERVLKLDPDAVAVMITEYGEMELAVKSIRQGATDFLVKAWNPEKFLASIRAGVEIRQSRRSVKQLEQEYHLIWSDLNNQSDPIIAESPAMVEVLNTVSMVAKTDTNILIQGEKGTEKELIARKIHELSNRHMNRFVHVDISDIRGSLFDGELFGYGKGTFPEPDDDRMGHIEFASSGTLFLDQIGSMDYVMQSKLLEALKTQKVTPVGSVESTDVDIRLITASNRPLVDQVANNTFLMDLYYRIDNKIINLPPLRERGDDVILLARYFIGKYGLKYNGIVPTVSKEVYEKIKSYEWPGNVQELENAIEQAIIMMNGRVMNSDDLNYVQQADEQPAAITYDLDQIEKDTIYNALQSTEGNISAASRLLGITRTTLYSKIEKHML